MAREVSILFSAKDKYSDTLLKIKQNQTTLRTSTKSLQTELDRLTQGKKQLNLDLTKAKRELDEAKKRVREAADSMGDLDAAQKKLGDAQDAYDNIKNNLSAVSKAAKQAQKDMDGLADIGNKGTAPKGGGNGGNGGNEPAPGGGTVTALMERAGMGAALQEAGQFMGQALERGIGFAYGGAAGSYASSILSGMGSGAAIGSMFAPGIGTAIGGGVGALGGLVTGFMDRVTELSEARNSWAQSQIEEAEAWKEATLATGSDTSARREVDRMAFSTLLGKDWKADYFMGKLVDMANQTPFGYEELTSASQLMLNAFDMDEILPNLEVVGSARAALGKSASDMNMWIQGLTRMKMTGKTTMEYLNYFLERGVPVLDYLADAATETGKNAETLLASGLGDADAAKVRGLQKLVEANGAVSGGDIMEMISKGQIAGGDAVNVILDYMGQSFGGAMERQSQTYSGLGSTLEDVQTSLDAIMGDSFNNARKEAIKEHTAWLEQGGTEEAYMRMGEYEAYVQNEKERMQREAMDAALSGAEYAGYKAAYDKAAAAGDQKAMEEASANMGRVIMEARIQGENDYLNSDGARLATDTSLQMIENVKNNAGQAYYNAGYAVSQEWTKGNVAAITDGAAEILQALQTASPFLSMMGIHANNFVGEAQKLTGTGRAVGLDYVPYDGFPALLHEGEAVLTSSQNRARQAPAYGNVTITGNSFTVREEADIYKIAQALAEEMSTARMTMGVMA